MLFKIKAKKATGELIEGVRESADKLTLARDLRAEGLAVYAAEAVTENATAAKKIFGGFFKSVSLKDKIIFASNLSSMITAGLTLSRSLEVLEKQTVRAYFKSVIKELLRKVTAGDSFSNALNAFPNVFPPVFAAMVAAGEESGNLPQSLLIVKTQMSKTYELRRKIVGAMIYPAVIVVVIFVIGFLMMTFMVPQLSATFKDLNVELPFMTRLIIGTSDFILAHLVLCLTVIFCAVVGFVAWFRTKNGKHTTDRIVIKLPLFGELVKEYNSAVIMRTVASLITAGVSMTESLEITSRIVQNSLYTPVVAAAATEIQKGVLLSAILGKEPNLFPVLAIELSEVGEETGDLPRLLSEGAAFYEDEIDQATKNLSTIIEPLLMIVIGLAVGFFVVAMIGPMYSLSSAIK